MKKAAKMIAWFLFYFVLQIVVGMILAIPDIVALKNSGNMDETVLQAGINGRLFLTTVLSNFIFVVTAIILCKIKKVDVLNQWSVRRVPVKEMLMPCIIAFSYSMFFALITYNAEANSASVFHESAEYFGEWGMLMMVLALLVSAPLAEEVLNRGILFSTLEKTWSKKIIVIVSAVVFGVTHMPAGGFALAMGAIFMGFIFAVIYAKTDSLIVVVVAHVVANLPDFILYSSPQMSDMLRIGLASVFLLISLGCFIIWIIKQKNRKDCQPGDLFEFKRDDENKSTKEE